MRQREGIEPRDENKLWMPTLLAKRKATPKKPIATASEGSPGSKDRGTLPRQSRELGRSHWLLRYRGRATQPDNWKEAQRSMGSRMSS